jgi:hypothetical protein
MSSRQGGLSFSGFLIGAVLLVLLSITGFRMIPAYIQDAQIKNIFNVIVNDPDLQKGSRQDILTAYSKRADVDNITAIVPADINVNSEGDRLTLSASYTVKVPLAGNISLLLEFNPSSGQ